MKEKKVTICLVSKQSDGETTQTTEIFSKGTFLKTPESFVISYDDTEATGFENAKTSVEVFDNKKAVIRRMGEMKSELIVENDKKHFCRYNTPFGDFTLGITSSAIENSLDKNGGRVKICYVLDINACYLGDFEIDITVTV